MKNWIGLDCQSNSFQTATANGNAISSNDFLASHSCGCFVCAAVPADCLFFENITIPHNTPKKHINQYLDSLFDVKIPVPIEDCITVYFATSLSSYAAFALHKDELNRSLKRFQSVAGCRPEFLIPAPFVLWQASMASLPPSPSPSRILHVHVSNDSWTLLACSTSTDSSSPSASLSSIDGIVSSPPGNVQVAIRNLKILSDRNPAPVCQISISGDIASSSSLQSKLATAFPSSKIHTFSSSSQSLPALLAQTASSPNSSLLNFAKGTYEHPARTNRRNSLRFALSLFPLFASTFLFIITIFHHKQASLTLQKFNSHLSSIASRLAARPISQKGIAAFQIGLNEFEDRIDPIVESIASRNATSSLKTVFAFAQTRQFSISSFKGNFHSVSITGIASDPQALSALTSELESQGFSVILNPDQSIPGAFSISVTNPYAKSESDQ